jgi:hypothetical protein
MTDVIEGEKSDEVSGAWAKAGIDGAGAQRSVGIV